MIRTTRIRPLSLGFGERLKALHWGLITLIMLVGVTGYLLLYSAGGGSHDPWASRHGIRLAVGFIVMLTIALSDIRFWFKWSYYIFAVAVILLIGVELVGSLNKGAQRWINLGFFQLQPSEVMKIALVMALARYFHPIYHDEIKRPTILLPAILMAIAPAMLVLRQPDLGTSVMLITVGGVLFFAAGVRWWKFAAVGGSIAAALPILWSQLHDYQRQRVLTFMEPERDPLGAGYHIIQSKIALGSGGLWGKGWLNGSQAQLSFLPEKQTDFAFTMLAEENGYVGGMMLLAILLCIILLTLAAGYRSSHQFGRLLAVGIAANFFLYVVINVAMVTGLIPVVGVPLPLISYGGTAMMTVLIGFGLVLCVDVNKHIHIQRFPVNL